MTCFTHLISEDSLRNCEEIVVRAPGTGVPAFLYDEVARQIVAPEIPFERSTKSQVFIGISRHNVELYQALGTASSIKMLVTTGEKVFRDITLWRRLSAQRDLSLDILMLNPESPWLEVAEQLRYLNKSKGFLGKELNANIEGIEKLRSRLAHPDKVRLFLYDTLPQLRITLIDGRRAIMAYYMSGLRTGPDTLFVDVKGESDTIRAVTRYLLEIEKVSKAKF